MNKHYFIVCLLLSGLIIQSCGGGGPTDPVIPHEVPCHILEDFTFANNPSLQIDYTIDCETLIHGDVTIEAGTIIEFTSSGSLIIDGEGSLKTIGTSNNPIVFRGETDGLGTWRGIYFESNSVHNLLDYCVVTNAGQEAFSGFEISNKILKRALGFLGLFYSLDHQSDLSHMIGLMFHDVVPSPMVVHIASFHFGIKPLVVFRF